jgi:hypothetical protein
LKLQGNIARWLKKEGDKVAPGEVLCEVETVMIILIESLPVLILMPGIKHLSQS